MSTHVTWSNLIEETSNLPPSPSLLRPIWTSSLYPLFQFLPCDTRHLSYSSDRTVQYLSPPFPLVNTNPANRQLRAEPENDIEPAFPHAASPTPTRSAAMIPLSTYLHLCSPPDRPSLCLPSAESPSPPGGCSASAWTGCLGGHLLSI